MTQQEVFDLDLEVFRSWLQKNPNAGYQNYYAIVDGFLKDLYRADFDMTDTQVCIMDLGAEAYHAEYWYQFPDWLINFIRYCIWFTRLYLHNISTRQALEFLNYE